jgi:hypothetical protein
MRIMGSEWERKRAAGYRKQLDKGLIELGTPHLFTQELTHAPRIAVADIIAGTSVTEGENLVIQKIGNRLSLMRGLSEIGELPNPHPEILSVVETSFGVAKGIIQVFHADALVAEICVC